MPSRLISRADDELPVAVGGPRVALRVDRHLQPHEHRILKLHAGAGQKATSQSAPRTECDGRDELQET